MPDDALPPAHDALDAAFLEVTVVLHDLGEAVDDVARRLTRPETSAFQVRQAAAQLRLVAMRLRAGLTLLEVPNG